ncbi:MAG: PEP-CTERM sorting domain-containing protein [Gammaproteobacteria bacterium]|nr:PEP-CTERM sorting domain-containing protein [Gammaproteobacteria bacterium]
MLGVAAAMSLSMNAQAGIVDLFTDVTPQLEDFTVGGPAVETFTNGAGIIGGQRDVSVELLQDTDIVNPNNGVRIFIGGGKLSFSNDTDAAGEGVVQWDGSGDGGSLTLDPSGLGGIDLASVANAFIYEVLSVDLGFRISIEAYTDANNYTKALIETNSPGQDVIPFANLENAALCNTMPNIPNGLISVNCGTGGPVNMADVGALQIVLNVDGGTFAVDLSIREITSTTVPEPTSIALLGAGLVGAGVAGRRRKAKKS